MKKEAFYFSHDSNARNDEKIIALRMEMGWEGYGLYWAIVEMLRDTANYAMQNSYNSIAYSLHSDSETIGKVIEDFDLFEAKEGLFFSESLKNRMEIKERKSTKAREAAFIRWGKKEDMNKYEVVDKEVVNATALRNISPPNAIKEKKVKESKVKERERTHTAFSFIEKNKGQRFEDWLIKNKSQVREWVRMIENFNDTVEQEKLTFEYNPLFARLRKYCRNWVSNQKNNTPVFVGNKLRGVL